MRTEHKPTLRTLAILELVSAGSEPYTLTSISRALGISPSTLFPIVHTLCEQRYLSYDEKNQAYSLGLKLFEIGSRIQSSHVYDRITEIMGQIVDTCDETCHFGVLDRGDVLYLAKVDSTNPIRMFSTIGKRLPAYGTAIGKALLKNYDLDELKSLYPEGLKPLTAHTITSFEELHQQLNDSDLFTYEVEESNKSVRCIALPIYRNKAIAAALSVAIPIYRYDEGKKSCIEGALKEASIQLEQIIPYFVF